jgi:hypothetical protein
MDSRHSAELCGLRQRSEDAFLTNAWRPWRLKFGRISSATRLPRHNVKPVMAGPTMGIPSGGRSSSLISEQHGAGVEALEISGTRAGCMPDSTTDHGCVDVIGPDRDLKGALVDRRRRSHNASVHEQQEKAANVFSFQPGQPVCPGESNRLLVVSCAASRRSWEMSEHTPAGSKWSL